MCAALRAIPFVSDRRGTNNAPRYPCIGRLTGGIPALLLSVDFRHLLSTLLWVIRT